VLVHEINDDNREIKDDSRREREVVAAYRGRALWGEDRRYASVSRGNFAALQGETKMTSFVTGAKKRSETLANRTAASPTGIHGQSRFHPLKSMFSFNLLWS